MAEYQVSLHFIFTLRDSGEDFVCADMPGANTLTIGIFAVLAQHEREQAHAREPQRRKGACCGWVILFPAAKLAKGHAYAAPFSISATMMEARFLSIFCSDSGKFLGSLSTRQSAPMLYPSVVVSGAAA